MSDETQGGPVMDGSDDATDQEKLAGLTEQVEHDHGGEGDDAKADRLRERVKEADVEHDEPGTPAE